MPRHSSGNGIQINCRGQLEWLQNVKIRLGPENMRRIRCSPFGHLFDIPEFHNQGQLLNHLIRKLQPNSQRRLRLGFRFGQDVIEFGPEEFCAITGLKMSGPPELANESKFYELVFRKKGSITLMEIDMRFHEVCSEDGGESELCFKMALVYIVYCVFFVKERTVKCVNLGYMHLMDDLDHFVSYPWGAAAYEFLVVEFHNSKKKLLEKAGSGGRLGLEAVGFTTVLQYWVYEIMPDLASDMATKVCDVRVPRILRWSVSSAKIDYDTCNHFFAPSELQLVPFELCEDEKPKMMICGVADFIETMVPPVSTLRPHIRKRKLTFENSNETSILPVPLVRRSTRLARDASPATSNVGSTPRGDGSSCIDVKAAVVELTKKFAAFESNNCSKEILAMLSRIDGHLEKMASNKLSCGAPVSNHAATSPSTVEVCNDKTPTGKMLAVPQLIKNEPLGTASSGSDTGAFVDGMKEPVLSKHRVNRVRKNVPAPSTMRRVTRSSMLDKCAKPFNPSPTAYDPFEADYESKGVVSEFQQWLEEARGTKSESTVRLPSRIMRHARYNWFDGLWYPNQWLGCDHIDALLNLLIYKQSQHPEKFMKGWTCLETFAWVTLTKPDFEAVHHVLKPYVEGVYPHQGGVPWHEAISVYAIANVNKNHWVTVEIVFDEQKLVEYNSISGSINWSRLPTELVNTAQFIPWLCARLGIWEKRLKAPPLQSTWDVVEYPSPPQQSNGSDCGIMSLKFVECLASGHAVTDLDPDRCSIFRRSYCGQLFEFGKKFYVE